MSNCPEKVNIILATYPFNHWDKYDESIENYFEEYRDGVSLHFENTCNIPYYKVLRYHIFGVYDVAYITLTESDKFAQKFFWPYSENVLAPTAYQIMTGITYPISKSFDLKKLFKELADKENGDEGNPPVFIKGKYKYCFIINLKLNPGHLIGGGLLYFNRVEKKIGDIIKHGLDLDNNGSPIYRFILTRSFSWNDITLTIFDDEFDKLFKILMNLRSLTLDKLEISGENLINKMLYTTLYKKDEDKDEGKVEDPQLKEIINTTHVFIETQTYLGVEYNKYKYLKKNGIDKDKLSTQIQIKVKTGHEEKVKELLENIVNKDVSPMKIFNPNTAKFLFGRTDITLEETSRDIDNNKILSQKLREENNELRDHIKRVRTKVSFDLKSNNDVSITIHDKINIRKKLENLTIENDDIKSIYNKLKEVKIPRHLRQKTIKVFQSYNNGVLDPVLTESFQDFYYFMKSFKDTIFGMKIDRKKEVKVYEHVIEKYIKAFEKGYQSRTLSTYLFEEMSDIDIDYQSSIQKLLSMYNSIVTLESKVLLKKFSNGFPGKIVSANLKDTVGNAISINFNVHHLTNPEFVIVSLHKEILNSLTIDEDIFEKVILPLFNILKENLPTELLDYLGFRDIKESNNKDLFEYVLNDIIRVFITFFGDLNLYYYYSWVFNLQNSSLYSTSGTIKDEHFIFELRRIMLVCFLLNREFINKMYLPSIELANIWNRHYNKLKSLFEGIEDDAYTQIKRDLSFLLRDEVNLLKLFLGDKILILENKLLNDENYEDGGNRKDRFPKEIFSFHEKYEKFVISCVKATDGDSEGIFVDMYTKLISSISAHSTNIYANYCLIYRCISYKYLNKLYELNNKKLYLLKRNLRDGSIHKNFNNFIREKESGYHDILYQIDSHGGIFFNSSEKAGEYYKIRDDYLKVLMDLNFRVKKLLF